MSDTPAAGAGTTERRRFDTTALITLGVAVFLIAGYWAAVVLSREYYVLASPPGSTFNAQDSGCQIFLNYLEELEIETETLQQFEQLPDDGTIILVANQPLEKAASNSEVRAIRAWIESGGRLVMIGPFAGELPRGSLSGAVTTGEEGKRLSPRLPSVYAQGVDEIVVDDFRMLVEDPVWVAHFKDIEGQVLLSRRFGAGEVVWLSSIYPVSNAGIGEADNGRLATVLAGQDEPVYFDEYHHGYVTGSGLWGRLGGNGQAALLLVAAGIAVMLVAASRRIAPAIEQPPLRIVRGGAYIASLAELYRKAGAHDGALRTLEEGLRIALQRRYGSVEAAAARGLEPAQTLARSVELRESGSLTKESFTSMARDIARARQEVEGRHG